MITHEEEIRGTGKRKILYGHILTMDTGEKIYMARRKHREIFRSGKLSISGAMQEEIAAWAIDENLVFRLRAKGVSSIGVRVIDTGDVYLTRIANFFNIRIYKMHDYTGVGRGGSRQRYVPLQHFNLKRGVVNLSDKSLY
jgi:hypothetical protein